MTGLENIIAQIEGDSKAKAAEIISKAELTAEKHIDDAVLKAEEISNDYKETAKKSADELILRAKTADEAAMNKAKLTKKQDIIKTTTDRAKTEIKEQSATEYFEFLESLLKKNALKKSGVILLSADDKFEMTESFKKAADEYELEITAVDIPKHSGLILVYGSIEINCTIDAVFDEAAEEITDTLNDLLFGVEGGV